MPSPQRCGWQSVRQAALGAFEFCAPRSQSSTPVSTKPSPHRAATQVVRHASVLLVLPSSHSSPASTTPLPQHEESGVFTHRAFVSSQLSVVHALSSSQLRGTPPEHVPPWHASFTVQNWPSSHPVPSGSTGWVQLPPEHTSAVQELPSSVQLPVRLVKTQPRTGSQVSVVHSLPSLQTRG